MRVRAVDQQTDFETDVIEPLVAAITPTTTVVADWHFADIVLHRDWDRPLVKLLRFFAGSTAVPPTEPPVVIDARDIPAEAIDSAPEIVAA